MFRRVFHSLALQSVFRGSAEPDAAVSPARGSFAARGSVGGVVTEPCPQAALGIDPPEGLT